MDIALPVRMLRLWTAGTRIACFLVVIMPFAAFARTIVVPPMAMPEFADTEVSTNMPFVVDGERTREIKMRFALDGCAANCIQVAFGRDADGDGVPAEWFTCDLSSYYLYILMR